MDIIIDWIRSGIFEYVQGAMNIEQEMANRYLKALYFWKYHHGNFVKKLLISLGQVVESNADARMGLF